MRTKKSVKRVTNSMLIIIAGVLLKDFTTVAQGFKSKTLTHPAMEAYTIK
jgi:hypothetical protein